MPLRLERFRERDGRWFTFNILNPEDPEVEFQNRGVSPVVTYRALCLDGDGSLICPCPLDEDRNRNEGNWDIRSWTYLVREGMQIITRGEALEVEISDSPDDQPRRIRFTHY